MSFSLSAHHSRVLSSLDLARTTVSSRSFDLPGFLDDDGSTFRLVEIADKACSLRRQWLSAFVECQQQFNYSQDVLGYLSQAEHAFTVLLVSGDDLRRVYAIIRDVRALLPGKIVVAVLSNVSPEISADLINRGADDVLHRHMTPQEGIGRLYALMRRREWAFGQRAIEERNAAKRRARLRALSPARLSPKEERILTALADREGRVVSYRYIASCASRSWDGTDSMRSLHVTMSHLRRKLAAGVWIETERGHGYALRCASHPPLAPGVSCLSNQADSPGHLKLVLVGSERPG